jgi:hypothetical protein
MLSEDMGSLFVDASDRERRALIAFLAALMSSGSGGRKP